MTLPIAVLVSGGGSNLQSIINRIESGILDARITLVLSNKADAFGLERARKHSIPTAVLSHRDFPDRASFDTVMIERIRESGAEAVVLAGFMRLLTPGFIQAFPERILNIHPALLPSFPGLHGQQQAADHGVRLAGCTVHFVDEEVDHGPIIIQAALAVRQGETGDELAGRILALEHRIYPQAIQWLAQGRLSIEGRHVRLDDETRPRAPLPPGAVVCPELEEGF